MRKSLLTLALLAAAPLGAQNMSDPDKTVADGGVKIAGWQARLDRPTAKVADLKLVAMGPGMHVTSGPAAIYWTPANAMKVGSKGYVVKASFTQTKAPMHPEAYGLIAGGSALDTDNQNYLYFLARGDGKFMVKHRYHDQVHTLADWTANDALKVQDAAGKATNELAIEVGPETTRFLANGTEVLKLPSKDMVGPMKLESLDGFAGIRVNHNLDVHVSGFTAQAK